MIGERNKRLYCDSRGYSFMCERDGFDLSRPPSWSKILFCQRHLPDCNWLFWSDADALVTNFDVRLESFLDEKYDLIITRDANGLNAGHFFIRNTPWSFDFLREVWGGGWDVDGSYDHNYWEQGAIQELYRREVWGSRVKVLHNKAFNSYHERGHGWPDSNSRWEDGDFIAHFPGGSVTDKALLMNRFSEQHDRKRGRGRLISRISQIDRKVVLRNKRRGSPIPDEPVTTTYSVNMTVSGIGDNVLGTCVMPGLMRRYPGRVFYESSPGSIGWVEAVFDVPTTRAKTDKMFYPYGSYGMEMATKGVRTRADFYASRCRNVVPEFPPLKVRRYESNTYVLCPISHSGNRTWYGWERLERMLLDRGVRTVVLAAGLPPSRFQGETFLGRSPIEVVHLLTGARCVVAADTGLAHVAGAVGVRTVVLCGPTNGHSVYDRRLYPTVEIVNGLPVDGVACAGCYWHDTISPACVGYCASLNRITPEEVCERVLRVR